MPIFELPYGKKKKMPEDDRDKLCVFAVRATLGPVLHGGGVAQIGEVTCGGSPHLSCKCDQIKMRDCIWTGRLHYLIQFFKQGPAYKKEGPDSNKGSNQQ